MQDTRTYPSRRRSAGIGEIANSGVTNPYVVISNVIIIHENMGNASAAASDGDCRRGGGGKSDVGSAASPNSCIDRSDVFDVGVGKQKRKSQHLVVGAVGIVDIVVVVFKENHDFLVIVVSGGGSEGGTGGGCSATTEEDPKGLIGAVLAGIDVDEQLRLALLQRNQRRKRRNNHSH